MMVRKTYYTAVGVAAVAERPASNPVLGVIGATCALAGTGGGTPCVPYFNHLGIPPRKAVGTASRAGRAGSRWQRLARPATGRAGSRGSTYRIARGLRAPDSTRGPVPGTIAGAQAGTAIAHRLQPKLLMGLFCAFLALASAKTLAAVLWLTRTRGT